jgi:hypothetical protein
MQKHFSWQQRLNQFKFAVIHEVQMRFSSTCFLIEADYESQTQKLAEALSERMNFMKYKRNNDNKITCHFYLPL